MQPILCFISILLLTIEYLINLCNFLISCYFSGNIKHNISLSIRALNKLENDFIVSAILYEDIFAVTARYSLHIDLTKLAVNVNYCATFHIKVARGNF